MAYKWFKENKITIFAIGAILLCLAIGWVVYALFSHQLINAMHEGKPVQLLNGIIKGQAKHPAGLYPNKADVLFSLVLIALIIFLLIPSYRIDPCRCVGYAAILIIFAIALSTGILGVDFGWHWDEDPLHINLVERSLKTLTFLPGAYIYPSMCYDLSILSLLPDVVYGYIHHTPINLIDIVNNRHAFKLRIRSIFIFITYIALFYIYILVFTWRKNRIEAVLASSLVGLSWEVAYHARWIAPDAILMQFGALTMMCVFLALNNKKKTFWLLMAAIAAGLGCGTKYPGGLLIIPVLVTAYYYSKKNATKVQISLYSKIILLFALTYLITTPGTLLQQKYSLKHVAYGIYTYSSASHWMHSVVPGVMHFFKIVTYFCMVVFSKYSAISCVFFLLAVVGAVSLLINEKKTAVIFFCFPIFYILLMSNQALMIVRNLLVLIPFFAILASIGCTFLYEKIKRLFYQRLFLIFISALLLINAGWLVNSSYSIRMKNKRNYTKQLSRYLDQRPHILFLLSKSVADNLSAFDKKKRSNITLKYADNVKAVIFYSSEVQYTDPTKWTANQFDYTWTWFGPYEVNFNYYPAWSGDSRILVMPVKQALKLDIFSDH